MRAPCAHEFESDSNGADTGIEAGIPVPSDIRMATKDVGNQKGRQKLRSHFCRPGSQIAILQSGSSSRSCFTAGSDQFCFVAVSFRIDFNCMRGFNPASVMLVEVHEKTFKFGIVSTRTAKMVSSTDLLPDTVQFSIFFPF